MTMADANGGRLGGGGPLLKINVFVNPVHGMR